MTASKETVQRFWDALAARDRDGMKALLTDDAPAWWLARIAAAPAGG